VKVTDAMPALFSDLDTKYANPVRNPVVVTTNSILSRVNPISRIHPTHQRRPWGRRRRLRLLSVVAPLLALCSCEWFVLLSCACACDLLIFWPYPLNHACHP